MPFVVLLVPFFVIIGAFVAVGLAQTHSAAHGTTTKQGYLSFALHNNIVTEAYGLSVKAGRWLISRYAASHLKMLTAFLHGMASLWKQEFTAMRAEAKATADVAHALERAIPREAHKAAAPALHRAKVAGRHADHALNLGHSNAHALHRYQARTNPRIHHLTHTIDVAIPRDIGALRRRTKELEDAQAKDRGAIADIEHGAAETWDWIRTHPLSSVTGLFAGAVVVALSRLGYGFLRCNSWRRLGRSIKCSDANILGDLLALATGVLATQISLEEFIRFGQEIEAEAVDALHAFIRE